MSAPASAFEPQITGDNLFEALSPQTDDVQFIDDSERALFAEARMGEDVISFLNGDAGRMIRTLVKEDVREAIGLLKTTSSWRRRRIQQLQTRIQQGETLIYYLADVIQRGEQAYLQLNNTQRDFD